MPEAEDGQNAKDFSPPATSSRDSVDSSRFRKIFSQMMSPNTTSRAGGQNRTVQPWRARTAPTTESAPRRHSHRSSQHLHLPRAPSHSSQGIDATTGSGSASRSEGTVSTPATATSSKSSRSAVPVTPTAPAARMTASAPQQARWQYSTAPVRDSAWASQNFMLGAGMVIIQPSTGKLVLLYERARRYWFFPKGRKDIGESLGEAALREAYEEVRFFFVICRVTWVKEGLLRLPVLQSGYRVQFLPLYTPIRAPAPPHDREAAYRKNTEPVMVTTLYWQPRGNAHGQIIDPGGEYLTFWYVGQIPDDAVHHANTGMPDEVNYESHFVTIEEAEERLFGPQREILRYAWDVYLHTLRIDTEREQERLQGAKEPTSSSQE